MSTAASSDSVAILAPTLFEYAILRLFLPRARVTYVGIGLARQVQVREPVVVAGVAGALSPGYAPGTVLIPEEVASEDGALRQCDPTLVSALTAAALACGFEPRHETLLTAPTLITGTKRQFWADRGFTACDMETGLLPAEITRFAAIRVILDTPEHSISERWARSTRAILDPRLWRELCWLAAHAPRFALRAGRILRAALARLDLEADARPVASR
jgi:4-hydroxy-3-methylbut-2-enyl diphosphate reductase